MKPLNILIILLAVCMVLLFIENVQMEEKFVSENYLKPLTSGAPRLALNLSSDREVYHSSDEMELEAKIETDTKMENLTVRVYGIKDNRGEYRVNSEKVINAEPPVTSETFEFRMPSCYGCAGVSPGEYEIIFEISQNGEVIDNCTKTVKLEK